MGNWINKHFYKSTCVKILLFDEGQKQTVHYVVPKGNTVTIKNKGTYKLDRESFFMDNKRIVTYVYSRKTCEPVNPFDIKNRAPFNPDEFSTAIDSKVASEILSYSKKSMGDMGLMLLAFLMVIGFGLIYYMLNEKIDTVLDKIEPEIVEVIPDDNQSPFE